MVIRSRLLALVAGTCVALVACTSGEDGGLVTMEDLLDFEEPLPADAVGVDLEESAPSDEVAFCDAAGSAPSRWITDAVFPTQFWHDSFAGVEDAPADIAPSIDRLVEFAERRVRWHLTGEGPRPDLDEDLAADIIALADAAVGSCPDLPPVVGLPSVSDAPLGWTDLTEDEVAAQCGDIAGRLASSIDEYVHTVGRQPRHQIEIEAVLPYTTSDFHGVSRDEAGLAIIIPVSGGACDLG